MSGRDLSGGYYSPLREINATNVQQLGLAWQYPIGGHQSLEATPLVVGGTLYTTGNWGAVVALDAANGRVRWTFDPYAGAPLRRRTLGNIANRGVALWRGTVYVAAHDCTLHALDAANGRSRWRVDTREDPRYFCTGAPLIAGREVVIGNGGADIGPGGLRGYVSAYDLESGALRWRTYTVPKLGETQPSAALASAAATWDPARDPRFGGGGTAWNALSYDAALDRIFVGTGNAAPNLSARVKEGRPLDRLYAASILALDADTGRIAWHYQTTPGDVWDYDAAAPMVFAELLVEGVTRHVLMQANKNGFFYVLDRSSGAPLSAAPYVFMSWSRGLDRQFRPIVPDDADNGSRWHVFYPGALGAHAWSPMAFSPHTGLVYVPAVDTPEDPGTARRVTRGVLKAWDPVRQRLVWEHATSTAGYVIQGGALATAGNLVIAGREDGHLVAYAADSGRLLADFETGAATVAAPMSFGVRGEQYLAVMQGQGGNYTFALEAHSAVDSLNEGRLLVLKLGGGAIPRPPAATASDSPTLPPRRGREPPRPAEVIAQGAALFDTWCARCHTPGPSAMPSDRIAILDRYTAREVFTAIVYQGALVPRGMPRFEGALSVGDVETLRGFVVQSLAAAPPPADRGPAH